MASEELMIRIVKLALIENQSLTKIAKTLHDEELIPSEDYRHAGALLKDAAVWLLDQRERLAELEAEVTEEEELAGALREKFGLLAARVVPGGEIRGPVDYPALQKLYGKAAAEFFDSVTSYREEMGSQMHVCVSGGQTILDMMTNLKERRRPHVHFYAAAMIGRGQTTRSSHVGPETTSTVAWSRSGRLPGHLHFGTVQPYDLLPEEMQGMPKRERHQYGRSIIMEQIASLSEIAPLKLALEEMMDRVDFAVVGLGLADPAAADPKYTSGHIERISMTGLLKPFGIEGSILTQEGAVGDLSYNLFDSDGKSKPEWNFFVTPGIEFYRKLVKDKQPVMVIAGAYKETVLRVVLKASLVNVVITDAYTAQRLLNR